MSVFCRAVLGLAVLLSTAVAVLAESLPPEAALFYGGQGFDAPFYTNGLPAYVQAANLKTSQQSVLRDGASNQAVGTLDSWVYENNPQTHALTFVYQFTNSGSGNFVFGVLGSTPVWQGVSIVDAGADGSGQSTSAGTPGWTNGNPEYVYREMVGDESIRLTWRSDAAPFDGTSLMHGNQSAKIWFETDAVEWATGAVAVDQTNGVNAVGSFVGAVAVPEPSSLMLLGVLGLFSAATVVRRRR